MEIVENYPLFTIIELEETVRTMKNEKASGPNVIPAEVYKLAFRQRRNLLLGAFNVCFDHISLSLEGSEASADQQGERILGAAICIPTPVYA